MRQAVLFGYELKLKENLKMFDNKKENTAAPAATVVPAEAEKKDKRIVKIMSKDAAEKVLSDIKNRLCDVDLDELCGDEVSIEKGENETLYKRVIQAIMCGLVYWDEQRGFMVQKLIKPIQSNEIRIDELCYKYPIKLGQVKGMNAKNDADILLQSLAIITGRGKHALEGLTGRDNEIAAGCFNFFDR